MELSCGWGQNLIKLLQRFFHKIFSQIDVIFVHLRVCSYQYTLIYVDFIQFSSLYYINIHCSVSTVVLQGFQMHNGRGLQKQPLNQVTDVPMKQLQKMIHYNDNVSRGTVISQKDYLVFFCKLLATIDFEN